MKILHVSTYDTGGAGISCIRTHQSLLRQNVDSKVLLLHKSHNKVPELHKFVQPIPPILKRVRNRSTRILKKAGLYKEKDEQVHLANRPSGFEFFSFPNSTFDITKSPAYQECDIVNFHWVADFLDYSSFFKNNKKKLVWTLHDMNPFTGGCHHADDCVKYTRDCINCPQLQGTIDANYANKMLDLKLNALSGYSEGDLSIVTPSAWLKSLSEKSMLFSKFPHYHIPHGLDSSVFKIYDKQSARTFFNLPLDKKVIFFASNFVENPRKGLKWIFDVFNNLQNKEDYILCSVGWSANTGKLAPFHYHLGNISDEKILSLAYSVADVFVLPSFAENSPLSIIEALFCGIPVISFSVGGIPEIITNGKNGILCKEISMAALQHAFDDFFSNFKTNQQQIRNDAIAAYSETLHASRYTALYNFTKNK